VLETLTKGFRSARDRFLGITQLSEDNVSEALREVRMSLLEADVDLGIVRDFLERVKQRCLGEEVRLRSGKKGRKVQVTPADHFTKACYEELVALMGDEQPLARAKGVRPVMLIGLQGTGKTSTAAKLARRLKSEGERPLLVAADVYRPAARDQLRILAERVEVEFFTGEGEDAARICEDAVAHARAHKLHTVILDTAGRLQIDEPLMQELEEIASRVKPEHRLLVCDSMMGREAVHVARGFAERIPLDGLILTKLDGDARGGAALAIRAATGVPVRYVTVGEGVDRLESFRPEGMASRILGMGDVVGLMQDFEEVVDQEQAEQDAKRLLKGRFTFDDFLSQLRTLQKMGPLRDLLEKMPFAGEMFPEGAQVDPKQLKRVEAIALSMTPGERARPETIDESRRRRIARGSGTRPDEVGELVQRFEAMRRMMGQLGQGGLGGLLGRVPGLGRMMGGGAPDLSSLGAGDLGALTGAAPNRATARALKAQAARDKRKQQRKHRRRGRRK
jgi:signal recognition particle subunit SRP54